MNTGLRCIVNEVVEGRLMANRIINSFSGILFTFLLLLVLQVSVMSCLCRKTNPDVINAALRPFTSADILTCHGGKSTGVPPNMNAGSVLCKYPRKPKL